MSHNCITLGANVASINDVVLVARKSYLVAFDNAYETRVRKNRELVEQLANSNQKLYGITTGLGDNCTEIIDLPERKICQINTVRSHATSVGERFAEEVVRAMMFVLLVHLGNGHSGIRLETLRLIQIFLNQQITPVVPKHGSVGYLSLEGHIALALLGESEVIYQGKRQATLAVLNQLDIEPLDIAEKEGLSLISGTTSATALAALAAYDANVASHSATTIAAMTFEALNGNLMALDERLHSARKHQHQQNIAKTIRQLLTDSQLLQNNHQDKPQDALSLRAIAQAHGATQKILAVFADTVNDELASSVDNPLIFEKAGNPDVVMGCNPDASYLGILSDSACVAITSLAKISERRTNRLISHDLSQLPAFLIDGAGLNNGLMIPQYSAVGLLGQMRILSHPASIDNGTTSAMQEDYVSMGYNAAAKCYECTKLLRYVLATELLYALQAYGILEKQKNSLPAKPLLSIYQTLRETVPYFENDTFFAPYIEALSVHIQDNVLMTEFH